MYSPKKEHLRNKDFETMANDVGATTSPKKEPTGRRASNESMFMRKQVAQSILDQPPSPGLSASMPGQSLPEFGGPLTRHSLNNKADAKSNVNVNKILSSKNKRLSHSSKIYDDPSVVAGYSSVPLMEIDKLPRGGISVETKSVGRVQFGIPPETIKDSMILGIGVPQIYIVPVERFCREMGPALGINLAEFEFPAYFNYFVRNKRCTLVVDSTEAETDIRKVFGETLIGPPQFRDHSKPQPNEEEDFDPSFPVEARPNFYKEFYHFRTAEKSTNYQELTIDTLIEFCHFKGNIGRNINANIGVPPPPPDDFTKKDEVKDDALAMMSPRRHTGHAATGSVLGESGHILSAIAEQEDDDSSVRSLRSTSSRFKRNRSDPDLSASMNSFNMSYESMGHPHSPVKDHSWSSSHQQMNRRGSGDTANSNTHSRASTVMTWDTGGSARSEDDKHSHSWQYSQVKWLGECATIYPNTPEGEEPKKMGARLEIFKMTGGTEYILHDIDENNVIVGKVRFSGTVRMPDELSVEGFLAPDAASGQGLQALGADSEGFAGEKQDLQVSIAPQVAPPTFHPPSFGVTVLGNSHGFDKNGSTSGYVLWVNGRGIMIDPPPYSSATLEREGIRPQMIVAIIITHCHADHDAGTFQKVMTGARVAIITTPTIYKSFIRKYSALSGLSPTLLRHSHRHRPAIIGQPLRFQGARFNFTYTLHTIPCIGFKVEWRGRSMVFTGDHLNLPSKILELEEKGVLLKERADSLRHLPMQECDALLHEAGAPPIHTPLDVLKALPEEVKRRLYVVHTSALPPDSDLRVAPTGTAGTIRLDQQKKEPRGSESSVSITPEKGDSEAIQTVRKKFSRKKSWKNLFKKSPEAPSTPPRNGSTGLDPSTLDDGGAPNLTVLGNYVSPHAEELARFAKGPNKVPPLVFLRPTCVSDAWFILNLLSAVPFFSSLSYANTMEVLEIAQVELFCADEVVLVAERRRELLCVVWEGTCVERETTGSTSTNPTNHDPLLGPPNSTLGHLNPTVWHAGDWTGPVSLQPDLDRSAEVAPGESLKDIVALSSEGVKVIFLNMKDLHIILKRGSNLYRKYLTLRDKQVKEEESMKAKCASSDCGEATRTVSNNPQNWFAFDSVIEVVKCNSALCELTALQKRHLEALAEGPRFFRAGTPLWKAKDPVDFAYLIVAGTACFEYKKKEEKIPARGVSRGFSTGTLGAVSLQQINRNALTNSAEEDKPLLNVPANSEYARLEIALHMRVEEVEMDVYDHIKDMEPKERRARNARDRFANKVLSRLYARRAFTPGLVFSRGHFLSDTSRMVSGDLAHQGASSGGSGKEAGEKSPGAHCHSSTIVAGHDGCVVMVFPRTSLVPFLDGNPGCLLSLLGTQAVV